MKSMVLIFLLLNSVVFAQCPNDLCPDAIEIGCTPTHFNNTDCTHEYLCINPHPASGSCNIDVEPMSLWFVFTAPEPATYRLRIETEFEGTIEGWNACTDMFEGSIWSLQTGTCDNPEYITNSIGFMSYAKCFCAGSPWPTGAGAWAGPCEDAECDDPMQLQPYWWELGQFPESDQYMPYTPCHQSHDVLLPLSAGTYYFHVFGVGASVGDGWITICKPDQCPVEIEVDLIDGYLTWTETPEEYYEVYNWTGFQWNLHTTTDTNSMAFDGQGLWMVWTPCGRQVVRIASSGYIYDYRHK